jgi:pantothenate kinase
MTQQISTEALLARLMASPRGTRQIIAIAGAPASGKSTLAEQLVAALNAASPGRAALLPMDGYHFDDTLLERRGRRAMKGAPDTFDVGGLAALIGRLRSRLEDEVVAPVFDRDIEIARAGANPIRRDADIIVVEGNYLLIGAAPWASLAPLFDLKVLVDVPEDVLRARLRARWEHYRLPEAEIARKLNEVDLPNGRFVMANSVGADLMLRNL